MILIVVVHSRSSVLSHKYLARSASEFSCRARRADEAEMMTGHGRGGATPPGAKRRGAASELLMGQDTGMRPRILLIDNYDSFTYNLVQQFLVLGALVDVYRNDAITVEEALALQPSHLVISPGPGTPRDAGVSMPMIHAFAGAFRSSAYAWAINPWWRYSAARSYARRG